MRHTSVLAAEAYLAKEYFPQIKSFFWAAAVFAAVIRALRKLASPIPAPRSIAVHWAAFPVFSFIALANSVAASRAVNRAGFSCLVLVSLANQIAAEQRAIRAVSISFSHVTYIIIITLRTAVSTTSNSVLAAFSLAYPITAKTSETILRAIDTSLIETET